MFASRYRRFTAQGSSLPDGDVSVISSDGRELRLSAADYALAQRFDGQHSTDAILADLARSERAVPSRAGLEGFIAELGVRGLMQAGSHEPLPPPAQTDAERARLGWGTASGPAPRVPAPGAPHPPSTMPGSMVQPALLGTLITSSGKRLGDPTRIDVELRAEGFVRLGQLLIWPLRSRFALLGLAALSVFAMMLLYRHHEEWLLFGVRYLPGYRLLGAVLLAAALVNLFSMSARAAAISHYTAERPRIGLVFGFLGLPFLMTDSAGAAERARRNDRLRVVGAGLVGTLLLVIASILLWFLTSTTVPTVATVAAAAATASAISLLLRLNPLALRDGYSLLANALGVLDLRRQSVGALFGFERPWMTQVRKLPRRMLVLYAVLVVAFTVVSTVIILWFLGGALERRLQGTGIVLVLGVWGVWMVKQYSRVAVERTTMGQAKRPWKQPTQRQMIIGGLIALACLLPYPYAPGGGFDVLPRDRADVRALTAGDVREVLVKEGDVVAAEQAIVRIDDTAQRAKVAASEAQLASLAADLALARKGAKAEEIEVAKQRVATAKTTFEVADASFRRIAAAYKGKSVTSQDYEHARGAADVARQSLIEAQRSLDLVNSPAQDERIQSLEADARRVQAELDLAREELKATRITAPIGGRVVAPRLMFSRGDYLERGELLATIEDTDELLAEIRIPETAVGEIELGAKVSAKFWAYPGSTFKGEVRSVAPNAEDGPYGRIVRVQVLMADPDNRLKPGLTGNAKVSAGWKPAIIVFTRAFVRFFMVELWSWIP